MIDIHCHILPEVDDGPRSWEVAIEMCRIAAADGVTHIVATPHANDRYVYDREYLLGVLEELRAEGSAIVIIMFTVSPPPFARKACLDLGANYYLDKSQISELIEICSLHLLAL